MKLILLCVLTVVNLLISTSSANGAVFQKDVQVANDKSKSDHQKFFQKLNVEEKEWVLRLAIRQERDELAKQDPIIIPILSDQVQQNHQLHKYNSDRNNVNNVEVKPVDSLDMIPTGLFDYLLNGQISPKFQKDMIQWLRQEYGFTNSHFLNFSAKSNEFCSNDKCWDLGDIGGECCPFG